MKRIIFFTQPFRRFVIKLTKLFKRNERVYNWFLDNLYPDDMIVSFFGVDEDEF